MRGPPPWGPDHVGANHPACRGGPGYKAPIQRVVDRVSAVFVPTTVLVVALLTWLGWMWVGVPVDQALIRAVAVLVIACPVPWVWPPAAIMAGTGAAAQRHPYKDPEALETAHRVKVVAFDKTGTLTVGRPTCPICRRLPGADAGARAELLSVAAHCKRAASTLRWR